MAKNTRVVKIFVFIVCSAQCDQWPEWGYKCIKDGCQGKLVYSNLTDLGYYRSLSLCRTICGDFGGLWPKPTSAKLSTETIKIHPKNLKYDLKNVPATVRLLLQSMTEVVEKNLIAECRGNVIEEQTTQITVFITVKNNNDDLTWETKEQYKLSVQTKSDKVVVIIIAVSVYGARHALETLVQLVAPDISVTKTGKAVNKTCSLNLVAAANITDRPKYTYRGFLLDTSRNFFPIQDIKRMIDAMASTKMNVFHWHMSDSHSFPLESYRVPQLARYGAYSESQTYLLKEVNELIKYAQISGVRVVMEIDTPGHASNGWQWGKVYDLGDLAVCINKTPWPSYCKSPPCGQLNLSNKNIYIVLDYLYQDIADVLLKPPLLHIGGDEVVFNCWNQSKQIRKYMKSRGYKLNDVEGFMKLWSEFNKNVLKIWDKVLKNLGVKPQPVMIWSSELTNIKRIKKYLNASRYVIEVWGSNTEADLLTKELIKLKYRVVCAPDHWYLDHGFWGDNSYYNWKKMYSHTISKARAVLGGEVSMWSELVDSTSLDSRVWPRAAAVAERLWSNPNFTPKEVEPRLQRMRERLVSRGIHAEVVAPGWCSQQDYQC